MQTCSKRYDFFDRFRAPRSIEASASIKSASKKNDVRFLEENIGRASKKLFGPRKPRCVDFFMQTYSERYDFFDRFRSFSSTAIDRGIGIGRFGVEKKSFDFCTEMYGAPAKNCSGPENRDASILLGKHRANCKEILTLIESRGKIG